MESSHAISLEMRSTWRIARIFQQKEIRRQMQQFRMRDEQQCTHTHSQTQNWLSKVTLTG